MHYLHIKFPVNSPFDTPFNALAVLVKEPQDTSRFTKTMYKGHVHLLHLIRCLL